MKWSIGKLKGPTWDVSWLELCELPDRKTLESGTLSFKKSASPEIPCSGLCSPPQEHRPEPTSGKEFPPHWGHTRAGHTGMYRVLVACSPSIEGHVKGGKKHLLELKPHASG